MEGEGGIEKKHFNLFNFSRRKERKWGGGDSQKQKKLKES